MSSRGKEDKKSSSIFTTLLHVQNVTLRKKCGRRRHFNKSNAMPWDIATAPRRPVLSSSFQDHVNIIFTNQHNFLSFSYFFTAPVPSPIKSFWKKSSTSCLPWAATGARKFLLVEDFTVCCFVEGQVGNEVEQEEESALFSNRKSQDMVVH